LSRAPLPSLVEPRPLTKPLGRTKLLGLLLPEVLVAKREAVARRPSSAVRRLPTTTMRRECAADVRRRSAAKVPRELGLSPKHHRRTKPNLVPLDVDPPEGAARHLHETYPRHRLSSSMSMSHLLDTRKASSKSRPGRREGARREHHARDGLRLGHARGGVLVGHGLNPCTCPAVVENPQDAVVGLVVRKTWPRPHSSSRPQGPCASPQRAAAPWRGPEREHVQPWPLRTDGCGTPLFLR
jgi:hypothetical protein